MSKFAIKYLNHGKVTIDTLDTIEQLLPVMAHVQEQKLPYYVVKDGEFIFKYNMQYLDEHKEPAQSWTLRVRNNDTTEVSDYTDLVELSVAATRAMEAKLPWYIIDNNTGKMIRKGNLDKIQKTPVVEDIDIDATIDEINSMID